MVDAFRSEETALIATTGSASLSSYVDWPAIIAGTLLATAVSFLLNTFGAAIGLSVVSPFDRDGFGGTGMLIAVALWIMWVTISSFMVGAYVAGRMRKRAHDANAHESDVRDGIHGLAVWAVGILLSALIVSSATGTAVRAGAEAVSGAAQGVAAAGGAESTDYLVGKLLRPAADGNAAVGNGNIDARPALMADFAAILAASVDGSIAADDKAYMASAISAQTGLGEPEATARVEELAGAYRATIVQAQEMAETARVGSVVAAFVLAASLLIAGAGAWWAAGVGGNHRDEGTVLGLLARRR